MNASALQQSRQRQLSPVESYAMEVIGDERRAAHLASALPEHIKPKHFNRNLVNLLMQNPKMLKYDPRLTFREVAKAAALGLLLDPQLGEAYIVPAWDGSTKSEGPQLRVGYRGLMKLARQTKEIADIYPSEVCENDIWDEVQGTERRLEHKIDRRKPRGRPFAYYAVVIYKDGTRDFDVMDLEALHAIRDRSDAWKAFKAGRIKSTPWATDEGEMCKKTVIRRLMKRVPQSPELSEAIGMENAADFAPNAQRLLPNQPVRHLRSVEMPRTINTSAEEFVPDDEPIIDDEIPNFGAGEPLAAPAAEAPATTAGEPASPSSSGDAGEPDPKPDPIAEARQRGRDDCERGADRDPPADLKKYKSYGRAWLEGYDAFRAEVEAEMGS